MTQASVKVPELKCSFCGKRQHQVKRFVAGPGVYICDECIALCVEIMVEEDVLRLTPADAAARPELLLEPWVNAVLLENAERVREARAFLEQLLARFDRYSPDSPPATS